MQQNAPPIIRPRASEGRLMGWLAGLAALAMLAGGMVLFLFDPQTHGFYPQCVFHRVTGWLCPGCGSLRALHQLLHGHVVAAFRLNALLILLLPVALWLVVCEIVRRTTAQRWPDLFLRIEWRWALMVAMIVFSIARNWPR